MRFALYLELGTRSRGQSVLDLLNVPPDSTLGDCLEWTARWWSNGKTHRIRTTDRGQVLTKLRSGGINNAELQFRMSGEVRSKAKSEQLRVVGGWISLFPSAMSEVWVPVPRDELMSPAEERNRANLILHEATLKMGFSRVYPSVAEYTLEVEVGGAKDDAQLQSESVELICSSLPLSLLHEELFGYACVHGTCRRQMMLDSLGGVTQWIDELGPKFENLYPILIGSRESCAAVAELLNGDCTITFIGDSIPLAIISIPPEKIEQARRRDGIKRWVVARDIGQLCIDPEVADELFKRKVSDPVIAPFVVR